MSDHKYKRLSTNPKALKVLVECAKNGLTDEQTQSKLAEECGYTWSIGSINKRRAALGIIKQQKIKGSIDTSKNPMLEIPPHGMSDNDKASWFVERFKRTHFYQTLQKQFEPEEIEIYLDEFGLMCCQFQDIVITEFMQIDDFIKHRILVDQELVLKKFLQQEISNLQDWLIKNPGSDNEDQDAIKHLISQQHCLDDKYKHLKIVNDRYNTLIKERQKIYDGLAATRKDRLDELKGGKETFLELVSKLQNSQNERDKQGKLAELTKIAAEDIKSEFRKPVEFPDGSKDAIIMDAETDFEDID